MRTASAGLSSSIEHAPDPCFRLYFAGSRTISNQKSSRPLITLRNCSNARSRVPALGVQALKNPEDAVGILLFEADAVVPDAEKPCTLQSLGRDMDARRLILAALDGIAQQIADELHHLGFNG
jgi:hypothetical protein